MAWNDAMIKFYFHTDECSVVPTRTRSQCLISSFRKRSPSATSQHDGVVGVGAAEVPSSGLLIPLARVDPG